VKKIALHQGLDHFNFHIMVVKGNQKHKTQMKTEVLKNESWIAFSNSYTLKKPLPKSVTIRQLKQIWSPFTIPKW
jgi:hypothetical protein